MQIGNPKRMESAYNDEVASYIDSSELKAEQLVERIEKIAVLW